MQTRTPLCIYVKTYWKGPQETRGFSREQGVGMLGHGWEGDLLF